MKLTREIAEAHLTEVEVHHFVTEASELGFAPAETPQIIETEIGNGRPFYLVDILEGIFKYRQGNGCLFLDIFND